MYAVLTSTIVLHGVRYQHIRYFVINTVVIVLVCSYPLCQL